MLPKIQVEIQSPVNPKQPHQELFDYTVSYIMVCFCRTMCSFVNSGLIPYTTAHYIYSLSSQISPP